MTKPRKYTSPILEELEKDMDNDHWYVKLKRWYRLQKWVLTCRTRKYWDKLYEYYIFVKKKINNMEVSMDGLRNQLVRNYNSLVSKLNSNIKDESWDPHVLIDVDSIQRELDSIRSCIVTLAFTYMDGEGGFKSMPDDTKFALFNPQEGEEDEG